MPCIRFICNKKKEERTDRLHTQLTATYHPFNSCCACMHIEYLCLFSQTQHCIDNVVNFPAGMQSVRHVQCMRKVWTLVQAHRFLKVTGTHSRSARHLQHSEVMCRYIVTDVNQYVTRCHNSGMLYYQALIRL